MLIYYNRKQYAQWVIKNEVWKIVSWSSSGNFAFFIERNSPVVFEYLLLDLTGRRICKVQYDDKDKDAWTNELFSKLPRHMAQEAYFKIISTGLIKDVFDYVKTLSIDDKRGLIGSLKQYYYNDSKSLLLQLEAGNFDDNIIDGTEFDNFGPIITDTVSKGFLDILGINSWRP